MYSIVECCQFIHDSIKIRERILAILSNSLSRSHRFRVRTVGQNKSLCDASLSPTTSNVTACASPSTGSRESADHNLEFGDNWFKSRTLGLQEVRQYQGLRNNNLLPTMSTQLHALPRVLTAGSSRFLTDANMYRDQQREKRDRGARYYVRKMRVMSYPRSLLRYGRRRGRNEKIIIKDHAAR